jgi:hypothetical protein
MTFQPQPLRSHALYILIKFVNFFIEPHALRFWFVAAAQLFKRLLNREFGCFSHADLTSSFLTISMQLRALPLKFALIKIKTTNAERPHEALAMKCPAELYTASPRPYACPNSPIPSTIATLSSPPAVLRGRPQGLRWDSSLMLLLLGAGCARFR